MLSVRIGCVDKRPHHEGAKAVRMRSRRWHDGARLTRMGASVGIALSNALALRGVGWQEGHAVEVWFQFGRGRFARSFSLELKEIGHAREILVSLCATYE